MDESGTASEEEGESDGGPLVTEDGLGGLGPIPQTCTELDHPMGNT